MSNPHFELVPPGQQTMYTRGGLSSALEGLGLGKPEHTTNDPVADVDNYNDSPTGQVEKPTHELAIDKHHEPARQGPSIEWIKDFMKATPEEKRALVQYSPDKFYVSVFARNSPSETFSLVEGDVSAPLLKTFSRVALSLLGTNKERRWMLTRVDPRDVRLLLAWAAHACTQSQLPPVPVDRLSCQRWMAVWKTAQALEMPLALTSLTRSLHVHLGSCNLEDSLACYAHALEYGLPVPEARFHRRLFAFAVDRIGDGLDGAALDMIVQGCEDRTIRDVAVSTLAEYYADEEYSVEDAIEDVGPVSKETLAMLLLQWESLGLDIASAATYIL